MAWDVKALGFKAYCPVCGKRLMLCDACQHDPVDDHYLDNWDYNQTKDCCKHNQDPDDELNYLLEFARSADFSEELLCLQLKALWTAYCLRKSLDVDTFLYDERCRTLWGVVEESEPDTANWPDYESFDLYLGELLG